LTRITHRREAFLMSALPIDLEAEKIQYDGQWCTRDELAKRIKSMLDGGDFQVTRPSQALEALTATLANLKTVSFRVTPEQEGAISQAAARTGKTPGALIREALGAYLNGASKSATPPPPPAAALQAAGGPPTLTPAGGPPPVIVTEEVSADEAAEAMNLTPKKKEEESIERGWFGR
jgi:hypothetical protein